MQFWKDDYTLLYLLQQKERMYFPYQHLADIHAPFFPFFGIEPVGYFALGVFFVFVSAVLFYYFVYKLFSNKMLAFMASIVFLTSPIGIDSVFMAMTFATDYFVLTVILLMLISLVTFYEKRKIAYYLFTIALLAMSLELVPYRTFFLIGVIMLFEIISLKPSFITIIKKVFSFIKERTVSSNVKINVFFKEEEKSSVGHFLLRQVFLVTVSFFMLYIVPVYLFPDSLKYHPETSTKLFNNIINYQIILNPLLTVINELFAGVAYMFYQIFYINNLFISIGALILTILFFFRIFMWFNQYNKGLVNIYIFSLMYISATALAFYPYSSREILVASHRYLTNVLPAYAIIVICIYIFLANFVKRHKKFRFISITFFIVTILINSITTQMYMKDFSTRSYYSVQFFNQMKTFIPTLPKNSGLYFQLDSDANVNYRLLDTFRGGHYDERAYFAVMYNMKQEDINPVSLEYDPFLKLIKEKSIQEDNVFGFIYSKKGLEDISKSVRESLRQNLENN
jgi:hypothetical protein